MLKITAYIFVLIFVLANGISFAEYKTYTDVKKITLPQPKYQGLTLEDAIKKRRSIRNYSEKSLTLDEVSQLLYAAQGISGEHLRTTPSAGASYPIELYILVRNVEKLDPGIYHYVVLGHKLEFVKAGEFWKDLQQAALGQKMIADAPATFILTAVWEQVTGKYGERGYRYGYMEAGHISQNIFLQATSLELGSVCIGAFIDDSVNKLLGVDGKKESAIYLHAIGKR